MTSGEMSIVEEYAATPAGAQGLAAADLAAQVAGLLEQALAASPLDQKALSEAIGVTEGRVSQIMNGDGNLRVAAVARYLRAMGYEVSLSAKPLLEGLPALPKAKRKRQRVQEKPTRSAPKNSWRTSQNPDVSGVFFEKELAHFSKRQWPVRLNAQSTHSHKVVSHRPASAKIS